MKALPFRKTTHIPPARNDERPQWALPGPGRVRASSQRPVSARPEATAARKWVMIRAVTPSGGHSRAAVSSFSSHPPHHKTLEWAPAGRRCDGYPHEEGHEA